MHVAQTKWVRLGVFTLPLAGLLITASLLMLSLTSGIVWSPDVDPLGTAEAVNSPGWPIGWSLFSAGLLLVAVGSIALAASLADRRSGLGPLAAAAVSILSIALLLPFFSILTYALPPIGQAYLAGRSDALELGDTIFKAAIGLAMMGDVLYWAAFIVFGVALWRSGACARWAVMLLAIHGLLIHGPLAVTEIAGMPVLALLGGVLLALAGWGIAGSIWRHAPQSTAATQHRSLQHG